VLVEVLLLRQQRERESKAGRGVGADAAITAIWAKFLSSLKTAILVFDNRSEQFEGRFGYCFTPTDTKAY
jgi:hypothetical protein